MSENENVQTKEEAGMEEDDIEDSSGIEEEEVGEGSGGESLQKAKQALTGRNVTLNTLMDDGIIESGSGVLSIDYLGQRFEADLLPSGKIKWHGSEEEFGTPSAWALHCKRLVNPIKRSGCGWASVKYKNKKLDIWKSIWSRKQRTNSPFKSPHLSPTGQVTSHLSPPSSSSTSIVTAAPDGDKVLTSTPLKVGVSPVKATEEEEMEEDASVPKVLSLSPVSVGSCTSVSSKPDGLPPHPLLSPPMSSVPQVVSVQLDAIESKTLGEDGDSKSVPLQLETTKSAVVSQQTENLPVTQTISRQGEVATNLTTQPSPPDNPPAFPTTPKKSDTSQRPRECQRSSTEVVLKERKCLRYSNLGTRTGDVDLNTLVRCEHFDSHNKLQPFTVSLTTNAALLMDFHCHLTRSEVVGYLGGRWDAQKQHLSIEQSFPVLCRLGDKFKAPLVEDEIRRKMKMRKMMLVGWYHSHPYCMAQPSVRDIDCQMAYQLKMRGTGSTYHPCIGFIEAPYEKSEDKADSRLQGFWVMPNLEHNSAYNIPMHISYVLQRDLSLTEDILIDMRRLTEFYSGAPDRVRFKERWKDTVTYLDKIRASLASKLPEDQLDSGTFLDFMQQLVRDMK